MEMMEHDTFSSKYVFAENTITSLVISVSTNLKGSTVYSDTPLFSDWTKVLSHLCVCSETVCVFC